MANVQIVNGRLQVPGTYLAFYVDPSGTFNILNSQWPANATAVPLLAHINGPGTEFAILVDKTNTYTASIATLPDDSSCVPLLGAAAGFVPFININYSTGAVTAGNFSDTLANILARASSGGAPSAPVNTAVPVISGSTVAGSTLTTTNGSWTGTPAPSFAYQWLNNGSPIGGATSPTYVLGAPNVGATITVTVTATNASGNASATSAGVGPITAATTNFYVATAGADGNPGTIGQPWQTITKVNAQTFSPNTVVSFNGGDNFSGTLVPPSSGTAGSPITFTSYGTGKATITAPANADGVTCTNLSNVVIDSLIVTGSGTTGGHGIRLLNSSGNASNLTVSNCNVSGFWGSGIFGNCTAGTVANLTISGCNAFGCCTGKKDGAGSSGIMITGIYGAQIRGYQFTNVTISNCTAHDNLGVAGDTNWNGSGIAISEVNGGLITGCTAYNNGQNSSANSGPVGIWTYDSKFVTIQLCESYNNKTAANTKDGGGFDLDAGADNCIIQYCYSHGNVGPGFINYTYDDAANIIGNRNNIIRFCISENDCTNNQRQGVFSCATEITSVNTGWAFYNNTVYVTNPSITASNVGGYTQGGTFTGTIANNIFISANSNNLIDTIGTNPTGLVIVGNDWQANGAFLMNWNNVSYTSFAAWQTATGQEKITGSNVGFTVDPLLASPGFGGTGMAATAYQNTSGSPLLLSGLNLNTLYGFNIGTRDYYGNAVSSGSNFSIGAAGPLTLGTYVQPWAPSMLAGIAFTWDTSNPISMPNDGSGGNGKVQFLKDIYDNTKIIAQSTAGSRFAISINTGTDGVRRAMTSTTATVWLSSTDAAAANIAGLNAVANTANATTGDSYLCWASRENSISTVNRAVAWYNAAAASSFLAMRYTATGKGAAILGTGGAQQTADQSVQDTNWHVHEMWKHNATLNYLVDGVQVATVTVTQTGAISSTQFLIGGGNAAGTVSGAFIGGVGPGIAASVAPSASDQTNARRWVGGKMGITVP